MRVVVVGFVQSIHAVRAVEPMVELGWDVHVVASHPHWPNEDWRNVTLHLDPGFDSVESDSSVDVKTLAPRFDHETVAEGLSWRQRASALAELIREIKPDLVDSMEIQHAGYLTLETREILDGEFPPWLVHNWGSDVYYFGRNPRHLSRLKGVLGSCDYYGAECHRDIGLARAFGFSGKVLPVLPNTGGFDLERIRALWSPDPTSARRVIALKATNFFVYRPTTALDALERCSDLLGGYRLAMYSASEDIQAMAGRLGERTGMEVEVISGIGDRATHEEILSMHGCARVSISLSQSDAICTSFLEAMAMGSFPVQSNTGCAQAWAEDGRGALFVDPEDPENVAEALRRALTDDALVDGAVKANAGTVAVRLDHRILLERMKDAYERIAGEVLSGASMLDVGSFDTEAMAERLLAVGGAYCEESTGATSAMRRELLALRCLDAAQPQPSQAELLPADASKDDWAAVAGDLLWVFERQVEQARAEHVNWARGDVEPGMEICEWYDTELLERDVQIASLRGHIKALQQSLDGFHRNLEQPSPRQSILRRGARRLVPARLRGWVRRRPVEEG